MKCDFSVETPVHRSARVKQLEGLFDLPPSKRSEHRVAADLPIEAHPWNVGLIVGPSGCGKSTIARRLFPEALVDGFAWPADRSIVDAFPAGMPMKEITGLLSSVGFSSPPSWLRPFACLSNGEQFRVTLARALAERPALAVVDEFTSVVDRTVAQIGSTAVAKAVRRSDRRFVAVACHYDIIDWLDPDWIYEPATRQFAWRLERRPRPPISLRIEHVHPDAWQIFHHHHYLSGELSRVARCFTASIDDRPVAFASVLPFPHPTAPGWRGHRTVCLPDFQGVGIGNAISEFVASLFVAEGRPYRSVTSNPAMIAHRSRSPLWKTVRRLSMVSGNSSRSTRADIFDKASYGRFTASFQYVGPPAPPEAIDALLGRPPVAPADAAARLRPLLQRLRGATQSLLVRKSGLAPDQVIAGLRQLEAARTVRRRGTGTKNDPHSFELVRPAN